MIQGYTAHMVRKDRAPGTIRLRLFYLEKFATWFGRDLALAEHDDFIGYLNSNKEWLPATRSAASITLRTFYRWATVTGVLERNPAIDLPNVIVPRRRQPTASEEQVQAAVEVEDVSDRAMIRLGAECGLRVNEIATLHRRNRFGMRLQIIGKGGRVREVYMSPELAADLDIIEATRMRHGHYFPGRSGLTPIHPSTAWRHIRRILELNPHSLRKRAGRIVYYRGGKDIRVAQEFLGHANSETTEIYLDVYDDQMMEAATFTRIAA